MNPWLEEKVKALRASHNDDELHLNYMSMSDEKNSLSWEDYIINMALINAIDADSFLTVHRNNMDIPWYVKKWLYKNNVDRVLDLVQITDEELRAISVGENDYYKKILDFLSYYGCSLRHCPNRTYKVSSSGPLLAEHSGKLEKWMINTPGTVFRFNSSRPTTYPEWFDEFYRRYEFTNHEDEVCKPLVPVWGLIQEERIQEFEEFFNDLSQIRKSFENICDRSNIIPVTAEHKIPRKLEDLKNAPLSHLIELKKDALRLIICVLEHLNMLFEYPIKDYIEAGDEGKLILIENEKDIELRQLLTLHVTLRIDFDNLIWFLRFDKINRNKPCKEWPINPWMEEKILEYRKQFTEDELNGQYRDLCEYSPSKSRIDFLTRKAFDQAIESNPALRTPIDEMDLDEDIKSDLKKNDVGVLVDLVQLTDLELNTIFQYRNYKIEQISQYLESQGLHLYHSDFITYKIPINK